MNRNFAFFPPVFQDAPYPQICVKFGTGSRLADVISCAKFNPNCVKGFDSNFWYFHRN